MAGMETAAEVSAQVAKALQDGKIPSLADAATEIAQERERKARVLKIWGFTFGIWRRMKRDW